MSYQYKGLCYNTPENLLAAMAADMSGAGVSSNGTPVSFYTRVEGNSLKTISSSGNITFITPELIECQLITLPQASVIIGSIALVWALAFGYRTLIVSLNADGGNS